MKENGVYPSPDGEVGGLIRHENNSTVNSDNSSDMFDSDKVKSTAARLEKVLLYLFHRLSLDHRSGIRILIDLKITSVLD